MLDCRPRAQVATARPISRVGAFFMICVWIAFAVWAVFFVRDVFDR